MNVFKNIIENYKKKDANIKKKIKMDLIIDLIIIIFLKAPFDLVRDFGYDKSAQLRTDYYYIWNNAILAIYIIALIIVIIFFVRKIRKKYGL